MNVPPARQGRSGRRSRDGDRHRLGSSGVWRLLTPRDSLIQPHARHRAQLIDVGECTLWSGATAELAGQAGVLDQASPSRAATELPGNFRTSRQRPISAAVGQRPLPRPPLKNPPRAPRPSGHTPPGHARATGRSRTGRPVRHDRGHHPARLRLRIGRGLGRR
jgi:hypothetical protein